MKVFNRRQQMILLLALVLFLLIGIVPPWRYLDGTSAGFHPVFDPPAAQSDTLAGEPVPEHAEIRMIPMAMYNMERKNDFTTEERIRPYLDIRKMMTLATAIFLGSIVMIVLFNRKESSTVPAKGPDLSDRGDRGLSGDRK